MNIGVHFFDMLIWIFGQPQRSELHVDQFDKASGFIELERAEVKWFLSLDKDDLPETSKREGKPAFRSITIDGEQFEFSGGFADLHNRVYEDIIDGRGYGIEDARSAVAFVDSLRKCDIITNTQRAHPWVTRG